MGSGAGRDGAKRLGPCGAAEKCVLGGTALLGPLYQDRLCSTKIDSMVPESTPCSTHMADLCPEPDDHNPELTNVSTHLTGCNTQNQHNLPQSTRPDSDRTELNHVKLQGVPDPGVPGPQSHTPACVFPVAGHTRSASCEPRGMLTGGVHTASCWPRGKSDTHRRTTLTCPHESDTPRRVTLVC